MTTSRPVVDRLRRRREVLARTALARIVETIPVYSRLPTEQLEGEILGVARAAMEMVLDYVATGEQPSDEVIGALRASAIRRAEERVPLASILGAYQSGADVVWEAIVAEASDEERDEVVGYAGRILQVVQVLTVQVSDAYVDEHRAIHSEEREADRLRLERLLGPDQVLPEDWPVDANLVLVDVRLGRTHDEDDPGVDGAVATRRKVRRVETWLRELDPTPAVVVNDDQATIAMPTEDVAATAQALHEGLRAATGVEVLLAAVRVEDEGPTMARRGAVLLADLAIRSGWADRPVVVDDLLVPYLIARVPEVRRRAIAARDRLADGPDLIDTLRAWFEQDFDRRLTASVLHVHPNTLDHRLRRIGERLGVDLNTAMGVELAALVTAVAPEGR